MKTNTVLFRIFLPLLIVPLLFNTAKATPINITTTNTNEACNGGNTATATATVTGGNTPYTYAWSTSPSQTTATATGLTAGTYTIGVVDAAFNTASAVVTVTQPTVLGNFTQVWSNVLCSGGYSGVILDSTLGGVSPYTYLWAPGGQTTASVSGVSAGSYSVEVTDNHGCTASATAVVTQPPILTAIASAVNNSQCVNPNGSATVTPSGGTYPYYYSWTPVLRNNSTIIDLAPGTYSCTVTDAHGCTFSVTATVGGTPAPLLVVTATPDSDRHCTGTLTASVSGGHPPYTYSWSPGGATTASISNLCTGVYYCHVTDNGGCYDTSLAIVDTCCMVYCANNYNQQICIVTLDTATNKCEIIWGRNNAPPAGGYGTFNIFRDTGAGYSFIHSQALNVLSEYIDSGSNPSAGAVSYELATYDSCGLSAYSSPHTSIYLTTTAGINAYTLNWTAYVGFTPTQYIIYRGPSLSSLAAIDSVPNTVFTYTDSFPPLGSYYAVAAENPNGPCIPTTHRAGLSLLSNAFSNGFNTGVLGLSSLTNNISALKIYPNPSNGIFTLNYTMSGSDNVTISIINELGQQVYTEQRHANNGPVTEQLNVENLASGIYMLRIQTSKGIAVQKLSIMQ